MEYYLIRKKFVEISGRHDLLTSDYVDNGADFFLNAGQRTLDRLMSKRSDKARYPILFSAGSVFLRMAGVRSIDEVWVSNADGMSRLTYYPVNRLREYYGEKLSNVTPGTPLYYAPTVVRPYPDVTTLTSLANFYDVEDLVAVSGSVSHFQYTGLVIMPPPETDVYVNVWGNFYSPTLSATYSGGVVQTASIWTELFPETLIAAAMYKLNSLYRDSEGAKDRRALMLEDVQGMDNDLAEEESAGDLTMEG
jgi:hypothetical protein